MDNSHRIKQLQYRANHRGIKEMDIILGEYANAHLKEMNEQELIEFETIMSEPDQDLLSWFTKEKPLPENLDTPLFHSILDHTAERILKTND